MRREVIKVINVTMAAGAWREHKGFSLKRSCGEEYVFVHFVTPAYIDVRRYEAGTFILYEKGSVRNISSPDRDIIHDWFHAVGDVPELAKRSGIRFGIPYTLRESGFISDIVSEIEVEVLKKRVGYAEIVSALTEELFARLMRAMVENSTETEKEVYREFRELRCEIMMSYSSDWSIERMAERVSLSPSRFYELYRKIFGISPQKDLQNVRIEHAKRLLVEKKYTVGRVAEMTGYASQYHFIRQFKRKCGISPGKYVEK